MYQGLETPAPSDPLAQVEPVGFLCGRKLTEEVSFDLPEGAPAVELNGKRRVPTRGVAQRITTLGADESSSSSISIGYFFENPQLMVYWQDDPSTFARDIQELPPELRELAMAFLDGKLWPEDSPDHRDRAFDYFNLGEEWELEEEWEE